MKYLIASIILLFPFVSSAQRADFKTASQVTANATSLVASESLIKNEFHKIQKLQEDIAKMVTAMQANQTMYEKSLSHHHKKVEFAKNVALIAKLSARNLSEIAELSKDIAKSPIALVGAKKYITESTRRVIMLSTRSAVILYNTGADLALKSKKKKVGLFGIMIDTPSFSIEDKADLLPFPQRVEELRNVIYDMDRILYNIQTIRFYIKAFSSFKSVTNEVFYHQINTFEIGKMTANQIVKTFNKIK